MHDDLSDSINGKGRCYLFLDGLQEIDGWEKAVNSLLENQDVDIYVTGSNSKLMSSEISTYLSGRYVSIPVYTLSFKEYITLDQKIYIQVCVTLPEGSSRETDNLADIHDHYHKYVVCKDALACGNVDGIEIIHIADFLLKESW